MGGRGLSQHTLDIVTDCASACFLFPSCVLPGLDRRNKHKRLLSTPLLVSANNAPVNQERRLFKFRFLCSAIPNLSRNVAPRVAKATVRSKRRKHLYRIRFIFLLALSTSTPLLSTVLLVVLAHFGGLARFMGPPSDSSRSERQSYRFPSSSSHHPLTASPSSSFDSTPIKPSQATPPSPRRTISHTTYPLKWSHPFHSGSDGSDTETKHARVSPHKSRKRLPQRKSDRSLTLPSSRTKPPELILSPPRLSRPRSRRSSSASTSSSSSSRSHPIHPQSAGIGRKVAASLDLFKESVTTPSTEEPSPFEFVRPLSSTSKRKASTSRVDDVAEPQFEFVKRSDWPDRETVAGRREKSTTLERVRTRESTSSHVSGREDDDRRRKDRQQSGRESVLSDLLEWRDTVLSGRGRRRERPPWTEDPVQDFEVGSPSSITSTASGGTVHLASSVELPERRLSSSVVLSSPHHHSPFPEIVAPSPQPPIAAPDHPPPPFLSLPSSSRSPPPADPLPALTSAPLSLVPELPDYSPWSTDDEESAWETNSITSTSSTTSASSPFLLSPARTSPHPQPIVRHASDEDEEHHHRDLLSRYDNLEMDQPDASANGLANGLFNLSQESLPHIPLRPFRNQVGGHSAIYKFTKRAVCKVCDLEWPFSSA